MESELSRERVFILTSHYKEMAKQLENIYPNESMLCEKYKKLDMLFEELLSSEARYQADFL